MESGGESGTEDTEGTGAMGQAINTELLTKARRQRRAACSCPPPRYARQELSDEHGHKQATLVHLVCIRARQRAPLGRPKAGQRTASDRSLFSVRLRAPVPPFLNVVPLPPSPPM